MVTRRHDLEDRLADLETEYGTDPCGGVIITSPGPNADDLDLEPYTIRTEPENEDDPIEWYEKVAIPRHRPRGRYAGGVVCITYQELVQIWEAMPEETRDAERQLRRDRGEPLPPILK